MSTPPLTPSSCSCSSCFRSCSRSFGVGLVLQASNNEAVTCSWETSWRWPVAGAGGGKGKAGGGGYDRLPDLKVTEALAGSMEWGVGWGGVGSYVIPSVSAINTRLPVIPRASVIFWG